MEEGNNSQALAKITNEVEDSKMKVILSSQCLKAQVFILDKLKKQSERHKQTSNYISSANAKLEAEIKHAEQEISSLIIAQETLKSANIEMRKEWLLAKHRKEDIIGRVNEGKTKYETIWLECKTRYESIPFVQKLLQSMERQKTTEQTIDKQGQEVLKLYNDIEMQRKKYAELNIARAIEIANFMIHERPHLIKIIKEKLELLKSLSKEVEILQKDQDNTAAADIFESLKINETKKLEEVNKNKYTNNSKWEDDPLVPKLNLNNYDLDVDMDLRQINIKKNTFLNNLPPKINLILQDVEKKVQHETKNDYMLSPYFHKFEDMKPRNFSQRKLINILDDININKGEVYDFVKKVDIDQLKPVSEISPENDKAPTIIPKDKENRNGQPIVSEEIEEIDLTTLSNVENIPPPTQFLDITLSDDTPGKRFCFDMPYFIKVNVIDDVKDTVEEVNETMNETPGTQDVSAEIDDSVRIQEILLKQQNLELSPQFVYAKNNVLQKKDNEKIITSKFFEKCDEGSIEIKEAENAGMEVDEQERAEVAEDTVKLQDDEQEIQSSTHANENIVPMDVDKVVHSSPKPDKEKLKHFEEPKPEKKQVSGLLFKHGVQDIPDSLNVSMSTTGYEDCDFPHYIDSSLLLSPKADIPATGDTPEGQSQGIPNFLSGFRNLGSFFNGPSTSSQTKPETSGAQDGNNFTFNFGGEKKNRGGLFSLFQ